MVWIRSPRLRLLTSNQPSFPQPSVFCAIILFTHLCSLLCSYCVLLSFVPTHSLGLLYFTVATLKLMPRCIPQFVFYCMCLCTHNVTLLAFLNLKLVFLQISWRAESEDDVCCMCCSHQNHKRISLSCMSNHPPLSWRDNK